MTIRSINELESGDLVFYSRSKEGKEDLANLAIRVRQSFVSAISSKGIQAQHVGIVIPMHLAKVANQVQKPEGFDEESGWDSGEYFCMAHSLAQAKEAHLAIYSKKDLSEKHQIEVLRPFEKNNPNSNKINQLASDVALLFVTKKVTQERSYIPRPCSATHFLLSSFKGSGSEVERREEVASLLLDYFEGHPPTQGLDDLECKGSVCSEFVHWTLKTAYFLTHMSDERVSSLRADLESGKDRREIFAKHFQDFQLSQASDWLIEKSSSITPGYLFSSILGESSFQGDLFRSLRVLPMLTMASKALPSLLAEEFREFFE